MEIILYITGGLALLALAWLFISLANTIAALKPVLKEVRSDVAQMVGVVEDIKTQVVPILSNVNQITTNVTQLTADAQKQLLHVQETVNDALDVVRGTLDDVERLKDEIVSTIEGPLTLARDVSDGALGAVAAGLRMVKKFVGKESGSRSRD